MDDKIFSQDYVDRMKADFLAALAEKEIKIDHRLNGLFITHVDMVGEEKDKQIAALTARIKELEDGGSCSYAGPSRGDCEHFVGLPGKSIPNQHDGKDDTVDCYGKPNGWCWQCWKSYQHQQYENRIKELEEALEKILLCSDAPSCHRIVEHLQAELEKWERPFDQERLDACEEQASRQDSLAAQRVYITALEHAYDYD
jgi:hypothetical protein